jgi:small subunit ribosomal protein S7
VERPINRLMQIAENTGNKQKTMNIVEEAFEIVRQSTEENPVQLLLTAVEKAAPREVTIQLE